MNNNYRRSSEDERWQEVKKIVYERDKSCRFIRCATVPEFFTLKKNAKMNMQILDPAHVLQVSLFSQYCYDKRNIVLLNRYSHENLDHRLNPVDGSKLTNEQLYEFWRRIMSKNQEQKEFFENIVSKLMF